jgi:hypothetical protein
MRSPSSTLYETLISYLGCWLGWVKNGTRCHVGGTPATPAKLATANLPHDRRDNLSQRLPRILNGLLPWGRVAGGRPGCRAGPSRAALTTPGRATVPAKAGSGEGQGYLAKAGNGQGQGHLARARPGALCSITVCSHWSAKKISQRIQIDSINS